MFQKVVIILTVITIFSCDRGTREVNNFNVVFEKTSIDSLELKIVFKGPMNIFWNSNILSHNYFKEEESNIIFSDIETIPINRNQIIIEYEDGNMRFFSNIPNNIDYWFEDHYMPSLPEKKINLEKDELETISFKIPYTTKHFAYSKDSKNQKIRLHYINILDSLNHDLKKNVITSNWINLPRSPKSD